jgi:5'-3' exonuclease
MISVDVDVSALVDLKKRVLTLAQTDSLLREIASSMLDVTRTRIHEQGIKSDGSQIGTYSPSYLELRREEEDRSNTNVNLVFRGDMERDYKIIPISDTEYGLGYTNDKNANKAKWNTERYGRIFALTDDELNQVRDIIREYLNKL